MGHDNDWTSTKLPNHIIALMPTMKDAELRVVLAVVRQTLGWHRASDVISVSQLVKLTGLSKQGVLLGIIAAISHGIIARKPAGQSYSYWLVQQVGQSHAVTRQATVSVPVQAVDRDTRQPVQLVDPQKKGQEKEKNDVVAALFDMGLTHSQARQALDERPDFSIADVERCMQWLRTATAKNPIAVLWASFLRAGDLPPQPQVITMAKHDVPDASSTLSDIEARAAVLREADPDLRNTSQS